MPFIKPEKRKLIEADMRMIEEPGDLCYAIYMHLVGAIRQERRWRRMHQVYKSMVLDPSWAIATFKESKFTRPDIVTALHLAWQVAFIKEVMPYENEKEQENGRI